MIKSRLEIKTSLITEAVSYLCKKAVCILPEDVYEGINDIYHRETSETARNFLKEILVNADIASKTLRPMCQDTGIVVVFVEVGQDVVLRGEDIESAINKGVERAYQEFGLRKSMVNDAVFDRTNTGTNTPAVIHTKIVPGETIKLTVVPKGSGSENMSAVKMLSPSEGVDGIINFVLETVKKAGPNSCPPLYIGIGIGGTMEYACMLAKKALLNEVIPVSKLEKLAKIDKKRAFELKILNEIQKTGIGAEGFGGKCTAFGVSIESYSSHIASLPVAVNLSCHATRHAEIVIDENTIIPEHIESKYKVSLQESIIDYSSYKKISLPLRNEDIKDLKAGDRVLLSGEIHTARDAAHKKLVDAVKKGESLPFELKDGTIYHVGPCPAVRDEVIGPAGPTTSARMDSYTRQLLGPGLKGTIGKGRRSPEMIESIRKNHAVYFVATGGAACLIAKKIISAEVVAYPELGPEAVYRLEVKDFPVIVAVDSNGNDFYDQTGQ